MSIQPGQSILNGKYHILRLIGEGGMARVWLAEELTFGGRQVALKEPRDDLLAVLAQEVHMRYQREVQVCAALDKARVPRIVRAFTADPFGDTALLAMEYMPGGDLAALLREHPEGLPVKQAVAIALDLLAALEAVHDHEMEIVHRDVKPSNILFDEKGTAYLADFGFAQLAGMSGRSQLAGGQHPGTPMYMAPEQAQSADMLLPAADLYAVGCVLFEMLTGKRYKRVRPGTIPGSLRPEVPGWLDEVVVRALTEDPWDRYAAAAEMAVAVGKMGATAPREAQEHARAWAAEDARRREAEERARAQAAEEVRRRQAEERARAQAARAMPIWQRIGIEMVTIPAGEFLYGDKKERIYLPEYAMAKTPVTNAQYRAFVKATGHESPSYWKRGEIPNGKVDHPVVHVNWHDAQAFCKWAGCRLPTEQEWEKGARGIDGRRYPWGDEWVDGQCNTHAARIGGTTPVDRYPNGASPYGLLDMAGNAWEWCEDWHDSEQRYKVLRGGSWFDPRYLARSVSRRRYGPVNHYGINGFRCAV